MVTYLGSLTGVSDEATPLSVSGEGGKLKRQMTEMDIDLVT